MLKLNLGSSDDLKSGFVNVDRVVPDNSNVSFLVADLTQAWPWEDSTVDEIYAKDIFEHIDNPLYPGNKGKIWVMNEAYRVLKPNGVLHFLVPLVSLNSGMVNPGAFCDPTHVSFWTYDDRYYFCEPWNNQQGERGRLGPAYGIQARFAIAQWQASDYGAGPEKRSKLEAILRAVK